MNSNVLSSTLPILAVGALCTVGLDSTALGDAGQLQASPVLHPAQPTGGVAGGGGCTYSVDDGVAENNLGFGAAGLQGAANSFVIDPTCPVITSVEVAWGTAATGGYDATVAVFNDPNNDGDPSDITMADLLASGTGVTANEGTDTFNSYELDNAANVSGVFFIVALAQSNGSGAGDFLIRIDQTAPQGQTYFLSGVDPLNPFNSGGTVGSSEAFGFASNAMARGVGAGVPPNCPADIVQAGPSLGVVDVDDLVGVILDWNCMGANCAGDANGDGQTNVDDLVLVILSWGPCPVGNDTCEDATFSQVGDGTLFLGEIDCESVSLGFNNTGAENESGSFLCETEGTADVWVEASFNCTGLAVITTDGSEFDTVIEVYDACGGKLIACDNDSGTDGLDSRLEVPVQGGEFLKIRIGGGPFGAEGAGTLNLCCAEMLPDPEDNDDCADAEPLAVGGSDTAQTITASDDPEAFPCGDTIDAPGIWYEITGTGNTMTVSLCGDTDYDAKVNVFCGPCDDLSCIGADDDGCGDVGGPSEFSFCSEVGRSYLVLVQGFGGATGNLTISLTDDGAGCGAADECVPNELPANDECIDATPVSEGTNEISTLLATTSESVPDHPGCASGGDGGNTVNDLWFTYTVDCNTPQALVIFSLCEDEPGGGGADATFDTDLNVFDASSGVKMACNDLEAALLDCGDDNCPVGAAAAPWHSYVAVPAVDGQTLLLQIGGWGGDADGDGELDDIRGNATLFIDCQVADDNLCEFAEERQPGDSFQFDNCDATVDDFAPICGANAPDNNGRWFWVTGTGNDITVDLCNLNNPGVGNGDFVDTRLNVYCAGFGTPSCDALECTIEEPIDNGKCPGTETATFDTIDGYTYLVLIQAGEDFGNGCEGLVDVTVSEGGPSNDVGCVAIGACCVDGACSDGVVEEQCAAMGGDFYSDDEDCGGCANVTCFTPPAGAGSCDTVVQQHYVSDTLNGTVRCQAGGIQTDNWFYREFLSSDAPDPNIEAGATNVLPASFFVCSVDIGIEDAIANGAGLVPPITLALYDVPLSSLDFDLAGQTTNCPVLERTFEVTEDDAFTIVNYELGGLIDTGVAVLEAFTPSGNNADDLNGAILQLGDNQPADCAGCGESAPGYLRSPPCGITSPTTYGAISPNFADSALIWKLNGIANP